jgi:LysR family hydrogen peroxide-inducible transcriptional activator
MVAAGAGVTLLPELASRGGYAAARGLVIRPFAPPQPTRTVGLVWRKRSARAAAIAAVAELISAKVRFGS